MSTFPKSMLAALCAAAFFYAPLAVHAGFFDDDEARRAILDMRTRLDTMQRDINARFDAKTDKGSALDLANQNEQLRQDIAKLRGQVEVLTNDVANTQQRQKDFYVDLDNRLRKLEPQKMTVDGKETTVEASEQTAYDAALARFQAGDYKNASASFLDFLHRYPRSGHTAAAQYWLGNSYYALREYRNAIAAQQIVVRNYPDNPRAPEALLNIASCYSELKDKNAAKKALETLIEQYGDSAAAQTAHDRLAALK